MTPRQQKHLKTGLLYAGFVGAVAMGTFFLGVMLSPVTLMVATGVAATAAAVTATTYIKVNDKIKNPTYKFKEEDGTTVYVTPTKNKVVHKLSKSFAKAADFNTQRFSDVAISRAWDVPLSRLPGRFVRFALTPYFNKHAHFNTQSFKDALEDDMRLEEMEKMQHYLKLGHQKLQEDRRAKMTGAVVPGAKR